MDNYKYMVQTRCMTYNHAPYILEAMNGFCMQKTTFPFVNVIVDDDSTDGEPEVIEKYLQEHFDLDDSAVVRREETDDYSNDALFTKLSEYATAHEYKTGFVMWPIRTALSGKQMTPGGATELMEVLGKEESCTRIRNAIAKLKGE